MLLSTEHQHQLEHLLHLKMYKLIILLSLFLAAVNGSNRTTDLRSSPVTGNFSTTSPASESRTSKTSRLLAITFPQWPNTLNCDATLEMCRQEAFSNTTAWRTVCFLDRSQIPAIIRPCSSVCLSPNQANQYRCEDFCPEYKNMCMPALATTPSTTTSSTAATVVNSSTLNRSITLSSKSPQDLKWPYNLQCDITKAMCRREVVSNTTAWRTVCFTDTSWVQSEIRKCSSICLSGNQDKCDHFCPDYKRMCLGMSTSSHVNTLATTTVMPTLPQPGTRWPDVIQCDVTLNMCQQEASSNTTAWGVTCFLDTSHLEPIVSLCSTICLSTNDNFLDKCDYKCTGYVEECINSSTATTYVPGVLTTNTSASNGLHGGIPTSNKLPWLALLLLLPVAAVVGLIYRHRRHRYPQQGPVRYVS